MIDLYYEFKSTQPDDVNEGEPQVKLGELQAKSPEVRLEEYYYSMGGAYFVEGKFYVWGTKPNQELNGGYNSYKGYNDLWIYICDTVKEVAQVMIKLGFWDEDEVKAGEYDETLPLLEELKLMV